MCLGYPAEVVDIYESERGLPLAKVRIGGLVKEVILAVEGVKKGDYVIVHAGVAISKIEEEELKDILELYRDIMRELGS
ncbi:hydrogenase expression/formation protein HypC [Thermogladius calderae 1633]|uniref:Hydrogenase expression/formation protein HypC n=1 Tax=Thermogladius calderae (strain DSM 22663 / VKM B-2946 / 1633) TaxID=1184251 RepID=I3TG14_THEC1|nr:HypC/HybG/HupF family hydrogenase formation chaperone [Thermogladius calderae]AFK51702.1 hydrogenase expression/formation protein HypC [Thermogladius calderae 1633]